MTHFISLNLVDPVGHKISSTNNNSIVNIAWSPDSGYLEAGVQIFVILNKLVVKKIFGYSKNIKYEN